MDNPNSPNPNSEELDSILTLIDSQLALDGEPYIPDEIIAEAKRRLQSLLDAARLNEVQNFETGGEEHVAFTYKLERLAELTLSPTEEQP